MEEPRCALFHLGIEGNKEDFKRMFADVKFVCMGGSPHRMCSFAGFILEELGIAVPVGTSLCNLSKTDRYAMYKAGPVLSVSHGIGMPSLAIILTEVIKLTRFAGCENVTIVRIGTCGGLGLKPGTVVVTSEAVDGQLRPEYEQFVLGERRTMPSQLDPQLNQELIRMLRPEDGFEVVEGKTMCATNFYEEQGRLDGAFCTYQVEDKMNFLKRLYDAGVRNIEMESLGIAAFCRRASIPALVICAAIVNRLEGDLPSSTPEDIKIFEKRPQILVARFIKQKLQNL